MTERRALPAGMTQIWIGAVSISGLRTIARCNDAGNGAPLYTVIGEYGKKLLLAGFAEIRGGIGSVCITEAGREFLRSIEGKPLQRRPGSLLALLTGMTPR